MSLALPTQASKISGISVPSSLRIENPAMCRSGFRPIPTGSPTLNGVTGFIIAAIPPGPLMTPIRPIMGCPRFGPGAPMLTPLNLTTSVLWGPLLTRSSVGVVAPTWPNSSRSAIRASRWPARFSPWVPTWMASSSSRSMTEITAVLGTRSGSQPLGFLDGVPALGIAGADEPADLDVVEWQLGLAEVGADGRR